MHRRAYCLRQLTAFYPTELLEIESATQEQVFGQPYGTGLVLRAPLEQMV